MKNMQSIKSGSNPDTKDGDYGLKRGGATKGYDPKQCPPLPNLGATPTNSKKGGYK